MKKGNVILKSVIGIVAPTTILLPVVLTTTSCSNNNDNTSSNTYIRDFYTKNSRTTFMGVSATSSQEDRTIEFTYAAASSDGVKWEIQSLNTNYKWEDYFSLNVSETSATLVLENTFYEAPTQDNLFPPQYLAFDVIVSGKNEKHKIIYLDNYYFFDPQNSSSVTLNEEVDTKYIPPYSAGANPYDIYTINLEPASVDVSNFSTYTSDILVCGFSLEQGQYYKETLLNYLFISGQYVVSGSTTYPIHMPADFSEVDLSSLISSITSDIQSFNIMIGYQKDEQEEQYIYNDVLASACTFDCESDDYTNFTIKANTTSWSIKDQIDELVSQSYNLSFTFMDMAISYSLNLTDEFVLSETFNFINNY